MTYGCGGCRRRQGENYRIKEELGPQKILEERVRRLEESNTLAHQKANWHLKFVKIQNVTLCVLIVLTLLNLFL